MNHYSPSSGSNPLPGQFGMGAHTDYGILTVLYADRVKGLQIIGPDGLWHDVIPKLGAFLVNLGDSSPNGRTIGGVRPFTECCRRNDPGAPQSIAVLLRFSMTVTTTPSSSAFRPVSQRYRRRSTRRFWRETI
jgi:hypothetical protein